MIRCEKCPEVGPCEYERICMCGSYEDDHGIGDGHSFVSMHDYYGKEEIYPNRSAAEVDICQ